jgi:hypothetical protein
VIQAEDVLKVKVASALDRRRDIVYGRALGDNRRALIDHGIEDRPCVVVGGIARENDLSYKILMKPFKSGFLNLYRHCFSPFQHASFLTNHQAGFDAAINAGKPGHIVATAMYGGHQPVLSSVWPAAETDRQPYSGT